MSYVPLKLGQYEPYTTSSHLDCVPCAVAQLINRATVDALRPSHADIRKASGVTGRGLTYSEAADAGMKYARSKGYSVILIPRFWLSRGAVRDVIASGRAAVISIDTSVTRYTDRRTNYFVGWHSEYDQAYREWPGGERCPCELHVTTRHGEFLIDDPGTTYAGFQWWSAGLVYRAAEKRTNYNGINLLVGPDTEGVRWIRRMTGRLRAEPRVDAKDLGPIPATAMEGGRTERGGPWKRGDGSTGYGWVHVLANGRWAWVNGRRVRRA